MMNGIGVCLGGALEAPTGDACFREANAFYDVWGEASAGSAVVTNRLLYTARETGEGDALYYRARYYQPSAGRFMSEDPISTQSYAYVSNNPTAFTDPTGLYLQLTGENREQAFALLKSMVGTQSAALLLMDSKGWVWAQDGFGRSSHLAVLLAQILRSRRCATLKLVPLSAIVETRHGSNGNVYYQGGGVSIGAEESLSGLTEILIAPDGGARATVVGASPWMAMRSSDGKALRYTTEGVLAHELGHALGNLSGETLYASGETADDALYWENIWRQDAGMPNRRVRH